MKTARFLILLPSLLLATPLRGAEDPITPISKINIDRLKKDHPRIMLTTEKLDSLRAKVRDDALFKRLYQTFYAAAVKLLDRPPRDLPKGRAPPPLGLPGMRIPRHPAQHGVPDFRRGSFSQTCREGNARRRALSRLEPRPLS